MYLKQYLQKGIRFDGRKLDEFRKITVEKNVSKTAEGSVIVQIGNTRVIAGVKMAVEKPYPDTPTQGMLMVNAELLPLASPDFESGPPSIDSIEMSRVVDRGIRESMAFDTHALCIEEGEKVWSVMIDICPLNHDGNLIDACALAAMLALKEARFPTYDGKAVDYKNLTDKKLPLKLFPIAVTVVKIGEHLIVDPSKEEEAHTQARLTITVTEEGKLCSMQKNGNKGITTKEIADMIDLALKKAKEIRKVIA